MIRLQKNARFFLSQTPSGLYLGPKRGGEGLRISPSAALIWQHITDDSSASGIAESLQRQVDGDPARIREDVFETIKLFQKTGAVKLIPGPLGVLGQVKADYLGELGDQLFIYCFARILAKKLGFHLNVAPIDGFINTGRSKIGRNLRLKNLGEAETVTDEVLSPDDALRSLKSRQIVTQGYFQRYSFYKPYKTEIKRDWLRMERHQGPQPGSDDIVMHVRSADIWSLNPVTDKPAPPQPLTVTYYESILDNTTWSHAYIVSDSTDDPVVLYLAEKYHATIISRDPLENFRFLVSARQIIMSASSSCWWAAWLSDAEHIHFPMVEYFGAGNHVPGRSNKRNLVVDDEPRYILHKTQETKAWQGNLENVTGLLRLDDPASFFDIPGVDYVDVVIPVAERDAGMLGMCIDGLRRNLYGLRRIITVSRQPYSRQAEWFDESDFPFSLDDIRESLIKKSNTASGRAGWYLQQLLKLYTANVIPGMAPRILAVDADTVFLNPLAMTRDGKDLFTEASEYHPPYFEHMARLLPELKRQHRSLSGISHHMLFRKEFLGDLFSRVEARHKMPFWRVFLDSLESRHCAGSGASEYEVYFNFMMVHHPESMEIRRLNWTNAEDPDEVGRYREAGYHYASFHHWIRRSKDA